MAYMDTVTKVWAIWRGEQFLGTIRAVTAQEAVKAYAEWANCSAEGLQAHRGR